MRIGKDAVSRIASRLQEQHKEWQERSLEEKSYPYLYLDATYLKLRWGARVTSMALLACVGVEEEGFREVLAIEVASTEKGVVYTALLRGLIDRGLSGVRLVVSDDHEGIKTAVAGELPGIGDRLAALRSSFPEERAFARASLLDERGRRGPFCDLQGQETQDGRGVSRRVRLALQEELP